MKIQTSAGTNCFVTPLNESSPTDLPSMKSLDTQVMRYDTRFSYLLSMQLYALCIVFCSYQRYKFQVCFLVGMGFYMAVYITACTGSM